LNWMALLMSKAKFIMITLGKIEVVSYSHCIIARKIWSLHFLCDGRAKNNKKNYSDVG
jgi:hypothetical protein